MNKALETKCIKAALDWSLTPDRMILFNALTPQDAEDISTFFNINYPDLPYLVFCENWGIVTNMSLEDLQRMNSNG